jgi:hypothetical protein
MLHGCSHSQLSQAPHSNTAPAPPSTKQRHSWQDIRSTRKHTKAADAMQEGSAITPKRTPRHRALQHPQFTPPNTPDHHTGVQRRLHTLTRCHHRRFPLSPYAMHPWYNGPTNATQPSPNIRKPERYRGFADLPTPQPPTSLAHSREPRAAANTACCCPALSFSRGPCIAATLLTGLNTFTTSKQALTTAALASTPLTQLLIL